MPDVGGARNVSFRPGDHRGTRQEGIIRAMGGQFSWCASSGPTPPSAFDIPT
jgi:branched-chain amino acid transport system substrate-binding protein